MNTKPTTKPTASQVFTSAIVLALIAFVWCTAPQADRADAQSVGHTITSAVLGANSYPDHVIVNGVDRSIKSFAVKATASGDNTLATGMSAHVIRLIALGVRAYSATPVQWYIKNDTDGGIWGDASTPFTSDQGSISGPAGEFLPTNPNSGIVTKTAGEDLEINLSAAVPLWVQGSYIVEPAP